MIESQEYKASFSVFDNTPIATTPVAPVAPIEVMDTSLPDDFFSHTPDLPLQLVEVPPLSAYADEPNVQGDTQVTAPVTPEINAPVNTDNNVQDTNESIGSSGSVTPVALAVVQAYEASKDELAEVERKPDHYLDRRVKQALRTSYKPDDTHYTRIPVWKVWRDDPLLMKEFYRSEFERLGLDYTQDNREYVFNCTKDSPFATGFLHPKCVRLMHISERGRAIADNEFGNGWYGWNGKTGFLALGEEYQEAYLHLESVVVPLEQALAQSQDAAPVEDTSLADEPNNLGSAVAS
ncbi:hypothetical protein AL538_21240 [Vibrio harveyi]|uniref:Uncharacterized protein n=1 Tax=Vibrio harveyi TaxID=669 RepID=A0ABN4L3P2_VIBHA|nr:hypothetical protein [Vibrio harveyi]AMG00227.1 hypothetical protein AL538_21240 [Vibrio harveyi]